MPILIAFYQALLGLEYLEPSHAGTFLWIANLSQPDRTLILPILTAASTFWQQKVSTANTGDQTQKYMLYFMPLFIGYLSYTFPAGLALYWVIFSVIGALQQIYVNRKQNKVKPEVEAENNDTKNKNTKLESKTESKPVRKTKKGDRRKNAR